MVLQTEGAVGPSGMDAQTWRCLCTSIKEDLAALCNPRLKCAKEDALHIGLTALLPAD